MCKPGIHEPAAPLAKIGFCNSHFSDIAADSEHVRFRGQKQTSQIRALVSANDPNQTDPPEGGLT